MSMCSATISFNNHAIVLEVDPQLKPVLENAFIKKERWIITHRDINSSCIDFNQVESMRLEIVEDSPAYAQSMQYDPYDSDVE